MRIRSWDTLTGVVCSWRAVDRNGCCATSSEHEADIVVAKEETAISLLDDIISGTDRVGVSFSTAATSCLTCNDRECCGMFEFCVSCCMRPAQVARCRLLSCACRRVVDLTHHVCACVQALRAVDLFASADPEPTPSSYTTAQLFEACTYVLTCRAARWQPVAHSRSLTTNLVREPPCRSRCIGPSAAPRREAFGGTIRSSMTNTATATAYYRRHLPPSALPWRRCSSVLLLALYSLFAHGAGCPQDTDLLRQPYLLLPAISRSRSRRACTN